jgi:hypothetical protein
MSARQCGYGGMARRSTRDTARIRVSVEAGPAQKRDSTEPREIKLSTEAGELPRGAEPVANRPAAASSPSDG